MTSDDDIELVIRLDRETLGRLIRLAQVVDDDPIACASSLLHDILLDDEQTNGAIPPSILH